MWLAPAIHAAVTRSTGSQRPKKTVFPPWRRQKTSLRSTDPSRRWGQRVGQAAGPGQDLAEQEPPDQIADVVADDRARRREQPHEREIELTAGRERPADQDARLAGDREARRLAGDDQEERQIAQVGRD